MKFLLPFWQNRINRKKNEQLIKGVDFETDSIRFIYDAYLAEYNTLRAELISRLELEERTSQYLFLIIAALLSVIQLYSETLNPIAEYLTAYPILFLVFALVFYIFSYKFLLHQIMLSTISRYIQFVLSPKLRAIAMYLPNQSKATKDFLSWDEKEFSPYLRGVFAWSNYYASENLKVFFPYMGIIAGFRYLFLSTPVITLIMGFIVAHGEDLFWTSWAIAEQVLFVLVAILATFLIIGAVSSSWTYSKKGL